MVEAVKRVLRRPAAATILSLARGEDRKVGFALCYHRVGDPQGRSGYQLVPALGTALFVSQIRELNRRYRLVYASELLDAVEARRRGDRFPLAVTFDDDLAVHAAHTAPTLTALGVPATFFVGGAALDGPRPFAWEVLQHALDTGLAPDDPLLPRVLEPGGWGGAHRLADAIRSMPRDERDELVSALLRRIGGEPPEPGLREPALRELAAGGFEIGFHTRDHESLVLLDDAELAQAMDEGRDRVESIVGRRLTSIAYPFGLADGRVADAARAAGFEVGYTLGQAMVAPWDDPLLLGRFQPSFESVGHTATELARTFLASVPRRTPGGGAERRQPERERPPT